MPPSLSSRLLFHSQAAPELVSAELSPELHDFIALALRAYVSPWWSKISRYDRDFLPHLSSIIDSFILALHNRSRALDLPDLCFHDVPAILTQHYRDYRNAAAKTHTAYASGGAASLPALFAHLQPHMAISPHGVLDREYYRQIVDHILTACLPPEDYAPDSERIIIREVVVKVLIDDVIPKITQPWFIYKTILDLMGSEEPVYVSQPPPPAPSATYTGHNFIVLVLSILQSFSGMCLALIHTYKQAMSTIKLVQQSPPRTPQPPPAPEPILRASSIKSDTSSISSSNSPFSPPTPTANPDNYVHAPLTLLSELVSSQDRFSTTTSLTIISMIAFSASPFLDKLLPHMLYTFLSPAFILNTTRTAKRTLFPNGYPGPQPPVPSLEEQAEWRARLAAWRGKGGLALFLPLLLGPDPSRTLDSALDPLSDAQCNLHLVVFLLDKVLVGLFPELAGPS